MGRAPANSDFAALRVLGGLFPPEFLGGVAALDQPFQQAGDYGLATSLRDELARCWRVAGDLYAAWTERREREPEASAQLWASALLRESLGFSDLEASAPLRLGERSFPITHQALGGSLPLLLWGGASLDRPDPRFGEEGRRRSPQLLMQELLGAGTGGRWGVLCDGFKLRLLRENPSLTRPAYLEADLERIFSEQLYPDFAALWLLGHASRFRRAPGQLPVIERWHLQAQQMCERALDRLRQGVTEALRQLGSGFLEHPDNAPLRAQLADGQLSPEDYFQQLLRLVYRLLFLFTAEERGLLHPPSATEAQRALYSEGYSLSRLRERARRRWLPDRYGDLWQGFQVTLRALAVGEADLGLPALGGLFSPDRCPDLDRAQIGNARLLAGIRALAFFAGDSALVRVNYRDMGTEELGSVYEGLLELHPRTDLQASPWTFGFAGDQDGEKVAGSERKLSGSYYTPAPLVEELLRSALEPAIADALRDGIGDPRQALLDLKVVDPACGSGHFLLAAARRLAAEVARAGDDNPDEAAHQHALREVVGHCIYGVDQNPLAVELCRVALWTLTVEPGKPLGFLDHRVRCGDSLIGVLDPAVMAVGVPEGAYAALTGDDRAVCLELKRRNRAERAGMRSLFAAAVPPRAAQQGAELEAMPEETLADIERKRAAWQAADGERRQAELRADLFVAAFLAEKTPATYRQVPSSAALSDLALGQPPAGTEALARALALRHRFFHWYLAFPEVMDRGGFDAVLANPPWERIELQEKEFFAERDPRIAAVATKAEREARIRELDRAGTPAARALLGSFAEAKRAAEAASQFARASGRYPLTGKGKVNTYALFAETALQLIRRRGRAGLILPTGVATDDTTKAFFGEVVGTGRLASLFDFENREGFFPAVDSRYRFCLLTLAGQAEQAEFAFLLSRTAELADPRRRFPLSPADIARINPNTKTAPLFRSRADAELAREIYARVPVLVREDSAEAGNPWGIRFLTMFNMASDSGLFRSAQQLREAGGQRRGRDWLGPGGQRWVALYEAKLLHQSDHRWATYQEDGAARDLSWAEKGQADLEALPRYWVPQREVEGRLAAYGWPRGWLMGWRDITNVTNERTVIASALPRSGVGHSYPLFFLQDGLPFQLWAAFLGNLNSLVLDFLARQKVGGTHLSYFYFQQLPVLPPAAYGPAELDFLVPRVLELSYTSSGLEPWAADLGYGGPPFGWDPDRRAQLRAELDAYYAKLYRLSRADLRYVLDPASVYGEDYPSETFRVLKEKELSSFGEYRTARLVLEAWDRLEAGG